MRHIAVIDLGSNSIRFVIMQVNPSGTYKLIYQEKKSIRLAEGMISSSPFLTESAQQKAINCLKVYRHIADIYHVTKILAVATAAIRNAQNGASFLKRVRSDTQIPMTIISGKQEAALGFSGVIHTIDADDFLLFDLGGASVEISLVKNKKRMHSVSIPVGAITLTEKFQSSGTVSAKTVKNIQSHISEKLKAVPWMPKKSLPVIGVGGTVRNLAKIYQRRTGYPLPKLHNYQMPADGLFSVIDTIIASTVEDRKKISGLSSERADIIIAGALLVGEIIKYTHAKELTVSGCGLREGIFYHWYDPIYDKHKYHCRNMLISSAKNYAPPLSPEESFHTKYVTALALSMFDQWQKEHGCSDRMRLLLYTAGLLHDAGKTVNYYGHARHSGYIIANAHIFGWSHKEQIMCSLVAAFHHGFSGRVLKSLKESRLLTTEDIRQVKLLSCFLSLAEGLDESYEQCVSQIICTCSAGYDLRIYLDRNHFHVPAHATQKISSSFEKLTGSPLSIQWFPGSQKKSLIKDLADTL